MRVDGELATAPPAETPAAGAAVLPRMTDTEPSLLALLQLADSSFPAGTFAHSYGLEQLARDGRVRDALTAGGVRPLRHPQSERLVRCAGGRRNGPRRGCPRPRRGLRHRRALSSRTKAAEELRAASTSHRHAPPPGSRHPRGRPVWPHPRLLAKRCAPTARPARIPLPSASRAQPSAWTRGARRRRCSSGRPPCILQASMRLLPVSHRDVQATLHRLRPEIAALAARGRTSDADCAIRLVPSAAGDRVDAASHRAQSALFAS